MRQAIRFLGLTVTIVMILIGTFIGAAGYSMIKTLLLDRQISFGQFQFDASNDTFTLSFPFFINNTGYFDFSDINLTTCIRDPRGKPISNSTTVIQEIRWGQMGNETHRISLNLSKLISDLPNLLVEEGNLTMEASISFWYAHAFSFQLEIPNMTVPWRPPLHNVSLRDVSPRFNGTHYMLDVALGFENQSPFNVTGDMRLEIYNDREELMGVGAMSLDVPAGQPWEDQVEVVVDPSKLTPGGAVHIYIETPLFSFGPRVMPYG